MNTDFPLRGVIGVVANAANELDTATARGLQCVEIRADLLLDSGLSLDDVMQIVQQTGKQNLACLFTLRHPSHGGKFSGTDNERVAINRQALAAGADIIDLEWGTDAARELLTENIPMILSHHDFKGMLDESELATLTERMSAEKPRAIKVVPTAMTLADAVRMLRWVEQAENNVARIGFAMGAAGACSRILTTAFGAPITYASFGKPVAPGQIAINDLLNVYRVMAMNRQTRVVAVVASDVSSSASVLSLNQQFQADKRNKVCIPFDSANRDDLMAQMASLRIDDIRTEES